MGNVYLSLRKGQIKKEEGLDFPVEREPVEASARAVGN